MMTKNQNYDWMLHGSHHLSSIADAYFPNYVHNNKAKERFRDEIEKNTKLWEELQKEGYTRKMLILPPLLIILIIRHWGMPDMVRQEVEKHPELRRPKMIRN